LLEDGLNEPKHAAMKECLPIKDNTYIKSVALVVFIVTCFTHVRLKVLTAVVEGLCLLGHNVA
jgi:hypothetical protein